VPPANREAVHCAKEVWAQKVHRRARARIFDFIISRNVEKICRIKDGLLKYADKEKALNLLYYTFCITALIQNV